MLSADNNLDDEAVPSFSAILTGGLGTISDNSLIEATAGLSLIQNVVLANAPQIVASVSYILFNQLLTCLLLSREFTVYSVKRAGLRVTSPQGRQRSTLWLSLPYRFSLPLLTASVILHWALSQTIFLAEAEVHSPTGEVRADYSFGCLGWSALAFLIYLVVSGLIMVATFVLGFLRYPDYVPIVESNSLAISAACRRLPEKKTEQTELLKYGIIGYEKDGTKLIGLGNGPVRSLIATTEYEN